MNLNRWNVPSVHVCWWTAYAASLMWWRFLLILHHFHPPCWVCYYGNTSYTLQILGENNRAAQRTVLSRIFRPRGRSASSFVRQSVAEDDSPQVISSGSGAVWPSHLSRSSSLLILRSLVTNGKRSPSSNRLSSSSGISAASHKSTPAKLDHPIPVATASRLAPAPVVTIQTSISNSIKYRLFSGSLVPLTP